MSEWEELLADVINASAGPDDEVQPEGDGEMVEPLVMNRSLMKQALRLMIKLDLCSLQFKPVLALALRR